MLGDSADESQGAKNQTLYINDTIVEMPHGIDYSFYLVSLGYCSCPCPCTPQRTPHKWENSTRALSTYLHR